MYTSGNFVYLNVYAFSIGLDITIALIDVEMIEIFNWDSPLTAIDDLDIIDNYYIYGKYKL